MSILYLHGFASGPQSRKARFFGEKLRELGLTLQVPDLAQGDFEHLSVSRQLDLLEDLTFVQRRDETDSAAGPKHTLIGSSLGGYLAALYAARHPKRVERLILLAPAFGFHQLWTASLGAEKIAEWKQTGSINVFHYGEGRELPLSYRFLEDAACYEPFPDAHQPALLVHGEHDAVVPIEQSLAFVEMHPESRLLRYSSDHELSDVLESIWYEMERFLLSRRERTNSNS